MSLNRYDCGGFRMAFDGTKLTTLEIIKDKLVYVFISQILLRMLCFCGSEVWWILLCFKISLCVMYLAFLLVRVLYLNKSSINRVLFTFIMTQGKNTLENGALTKLI